MAAGQHDVYVYFAREYRWTKSQVDAEDADYVAELLIAGQAYSDKAKLEKAAREARKELMEDDD